MKKQTLGVLILFLLVFQHSFAQFPAKNTDVSPLLISEFIPDTTIVAVDGTKQSTKNIFSNKPTVLIFYRGGWCPYCNLHLVEIQKVEKDIVSMGFQIIAVSTDSPKNLNLTTAKDSLKYSLYSDSNGALAKSIGIAYKAPKNYEPILKTGSEGVNPGFLPVPSLFVVDTSGKIVFEYISLDIKNRISAELVLSVLKSLKSKKLNTTER